MAKQQNSLDLSGINKQRLGVVGAGVVGVIATFMDWWSTDFKYFDNRTISGNELADGAFGWFTLIMFALIIGVSLLGPLKKQLSDKSLGMVLAAGVATVIFPVINIIQLRSSFNDADIDLDNLEIKFGLYLTAIAGLAVVGIANYFKEKKD